MSPDEEKLFEALKTAPDSTMHIDDVCSLFPDVSRHAMIIRIKYLAAKLAPKGWIIERVSGVGRGAKAVYAIKQMFGEGE